MHAKNALSEARNILEAMVENGTEWRIVRVYCLVCNALDDFFDDQEDTAALSQCFPDEIVGELGAEPPFPAT